LPCLPWRVQSRPTPAPHTAFTESTLSVGPMVGERIRPTHAPLPRERYMNTRRREPRPKTPCYPPSPPPLTATEGTRTSHPLLWFAPCFRISAPLHSEQTRTHFVPNRHPHASFRTDMCTHRRIGTCRRAIGSIPVVGSSVAHQCKHSNAAAEPNAKQSAQQIRLCRGTPPASCVFDPKRFCAQLHSGYRHVCSRG
jgi:hypothetical protein